MKRKHLLFLGFMILVSFVIIGPNYYAKAAGYPSIYPKNGYTITIEQRQIALIQYEIFPEFKNEECVVKIYNSDGVEVANATHSFYNSSKQINSYTVTWDTWDVAPGEYKVVAQMRFYSLYRWNEAPNSLTTTVIIEDPTARKAGWYKNADGTWCYLKNGGKALTGWQKIGNNWYYFSPDLETYGEMQVGWQQISGSWYYLNNGKMATGWKKIAGSWYYFGTNGKMATKWKKIGGSWYYFGNNGKMVTGWKKIGGKWYYFNSGKMVTGTKTIDGKTYRFSSDGKLIS